MLAAWSTSPGEARALDQQARDVREVHVELRGSTIRALCTDGPRQVVLLHGASSFADTWRPVLQLLDEGVGACAYDRRGSGQSVPAPEPRGWLELLEELRAIHRELDVEERYVLVGHSLGGLYARLYAIERRGELGGLVLVDPEHEDMLRRSRTGMPRAEWERLDELQRVPNDDGVVERELAQRLGRRRLPDIPVTVLTARIRPDGGGWNARFVNEAAQQLHASILQGVRVARHIPAARSGHDIQEDEPELVAAEIVRLVRAARRVEARSPRP